MKLEHSQQPTPCRQQRGWQASHVQRLLHATTEPPVSSTQRPQPTYAPHLNPIAHQACSTSSTAAPAPPNRRGTPQGLFKPATQQHDTHLCNGLHSTRDHHGDATVTNSLCRADSKALHVVAPTRKHLRHLRTHTAAVTAAAKPRCHDGVGIEAVTDWVVEGATAWQPQNLVTVHACSAQRLGLPLPGPSLQRSSHTLSHTNSLSLSLTCCSTPGTSATRICRVWAWNSPTGAAPAPHTTHHSTAQHATARGELQTCPSQHTHFLFLHSPSQAVGRSAPDYELQSHTHAAELKGTKLGGLGVESVVVALSRFGGLALTEPHLHGPL